MEYVSFTTCPLCQSGQIETWDKPGNISRCHNCGFIFDNPRPSFKEISNFYSTPTKYDAWISDLPQRDILWKRRLVKVKKHISSGSLLDIGSGIGQFLFYAQEDFHPVFGTEISDTAIALARDNFALTLKKGRIEEVEFERSFDIITLFHVLEHVEDPKRIMNIIYDLLNPGGIMCIAVPNDISSIKQRMKRMVKKIFPKAIRGFGVSGLPKITLDESQGEIHLSHFTPHVLTSFLKKHGFIILEESLDPFFVSSGARRIFDEVYYRLHSIFFTPTGKNLYDTIWIVAKKQ